MHGGAAPQVLRKSQERIAMAQDDAASNLVRWMQDESVPFTERRKCAEALLNRGGNAPGQRLEVSLDPAPWQELIDGIVAEVPDGALGKHGALLGGEVVDAEVVPDLPPAAALDPAPAPAPTPLGTEDVRIPSRRRVRRQVVGR